MSETRAASAARWLARALGPGSLVAVAWIAVPTLLLNSLWTFLGAALSVVLGVALSGYGLLRAVAGNALDDPERQRVALAFVGEFVAMVAAPLIGLGAWLGVIALGIASENVEFHIFEAEPQHYPSEDAWLAWAVIAGFTAAALSWWLMTLYCRRRSQES